MRLRRGVSGGVSDTLPSKPRNRGKPSGRRTKSEKSWRWIVVIRAIFKAFQAENGPFSGLFRLGFVGRVLENFTFNVLNMSDLSGYSACTRNARKCCVSP
jgi:hypothetical protein